MDETGLARMPHRSSRSPTTKPLVPRSATTTLMPLRPAAGSVRAKIRQMSAMPLVAKYDLRDGHTDDEPFIAEENRSDLPPGWFPLVRRS